jgi:hypothetical protein
MHADPWHGFPKPIFRGADAVLVCFDLGSDFQAVVPDRVQLVRVAAHREQLGARASHHDANDSTNVPSVVLVGFKMRTPVAEPEGFSNCVTASRQTAESLGCAGFVEVSTNYGGENVDEAFLLAVSDVVRRRQLLLLGQSAATPAARSPS